MKKISLIFIFILFSGICFCSGQYSSLEAEMKDYLVETLRKNYGEKSEDKLLIDFFTSYKNNKGEIHLIIDKIKLNEINKMLSEDSVYFKYYPRLIFSKTKDDFLNAKNDSLPEIIFSPSKNDKTLTKFGVYLNFDYFSHVKKELKNEAIDSIAAYYQSTGLISYLIVSDSFIKCEECLSKLGTKEFLAILFWKYFCDLANYELYKFN